MLALLLSTAFAYEGDTVPFHLEDETNLFESVGYDSGWIPSSSPVSVAFRLQALGGSSVEMDGESTMEWPPALTQSYVPYDGQGFFAMATTLRAAVDMKVDLWAYRNEWAIAEETADFEGETRFTPWLFRGSEQEAAEIISSGAPSELFNLAYAIVSGVEIYLRTDLRTDAMGTFEGVRFTAGDQVVEFDGQTALYPPIPGGELTLDPVFTGRYGASLDLVLVPEFGVCIVALGCYDVASFEFPVPMASGEVEKDFAPVEITHYYPLLDVDTADIDFGDVDLGAIRTHELSLNNLGSLVLDGEVGIVGAGEFSAFPLEIYAQGGGSDGITITFAPTVEGPQESTLVLSSSDPVQPDVAIIIRGNGIGPDDDMKTIPSEVGCNCSSTPEQPGVGFGLAALLGLVALRRRRG